MGGLEVWQTLGVRGLTPLPPEARSVARKRQARSDLFNLPVRRWGRAGGRILGRPGPCRLR